MSRFFFFGNFFYGVCAVALALEATLQQMLDLLSWKFYWGVFIAVIVYYTQAYLKDQSGIHHERNRWYTHHYKFLQKLQVVYLLILITLIAVYAMEFNISFRNQTPLFYLLLFTVPFMAIFYHGVGEMLFRKYSLRSIGWLKPFVIGFTWSGLVTLYPAMFSAMEKGTVFELSWLYTFLFIKNMMFISVLCIMFDVKDYVDDYNQRLKTFVTRFGLRKTIVFIISPLVILGLASFLVIATIREFSMMKIAINTIPFIALFVVARSLFKRKNIMYYLTIIDGLMLLKAVCGVVGMVWF
ncbi:MAG: hypothetical protein IPP69_07805 [Flavobacteriales bacterium]|nr:hypothetical protein [Flavobacteriales bacterium]